MRSSRLTKPKRKKNKLYTQNPIYNDEGPVLRPGPSSLKAKSVYVNCSLNCLFDFPDEGPDAYFLVYLIDAFHGLKKRGHLIRFDEGESNTVDLGPGMGSEMRYASKRAYPLNIIPLSIAPDAEVFERVLYLFCQGQVIYYHHCFHV